jgi:hypothetical protein
LLVLVLEAGISEAEVVDVSTCVVVDDVTLVLAVVPSVDAVEV